MFYASVQSPSGRPLGKVQSRQPSPTQSLLSAPGVSVSPTVHQASCGHQGDAVFLSAGPCAGSVPAWTALCLFCADTFSSFRPCPSSARSIFNLPRPGGRCPGRSHGAVRFPRCVETDRFSVSPGLGSRGEQGSALTSLCTSRAWHVREPIMSLTLDDNSGRRAEQELSPISWARKPRLRGTRSECHLSVT